MAKTKEPNRRDNIIHLTRLLLDEPALLSDLGRHNLEWTLRAEIGYLLCDILDELRKGKDDGKPL